MTSRLDDELADLDRAERRLEERASVRTAARERRARRRAFLRSLLGTPMKVVVLAIVGTAVVSGGLELAGGDLGDWPAAAALAAVVAAFLLPAAIVGALSRSVVAALATFGLQLALTFWVCFTLLGLGPA
jgi:fatty acid desaturase